MLLAIFILSFSFTICRAAKYTFRIAHDVPTNTLTHKVCMDFKKLVEKRTNGRMKVMVFPAGQLGRSNELVDKTAKGVIQAGYQSISQYSGLSPHLRFLLLPYLWPDWDIFTKYMLSEEVKELYTEIESKGIILVQLSNIMEFSVYTTNKEVKSYKDLKGLKIRTQENPIPIGTFKALGASPMPLTFAELYPALQRGVFDGVAMGAQFVLAAKFYEVCKYASISQSFWSPCSFAVNKEYWEDLPNEIRNICQTTLDELFPAHVKEYKTEYADYIKQLKEKGLKFRLITTEDALARRALTKPLRTEVAKELGLEKTLEHLEAKYDPLWKKYNELIKWYLE